MSKRDTRKTLRSRLSLPAAEPWETGPPIPFVTHDQRRSRDW